MRRKAEPFLGKKVHLLRSRIRLIKRYDPQTITVRSRRHSVRAGGVSPGIVQCAGEVDSPKITREVARELFHILHQII